MIIQKSIKLAMEVFEQKMEDFADKVNVKELTADFAMDFSATLKDAFSEAGRKAYQRFIEFHDINETTLEINGEILRQKMVSPKIFLTPFGLIQIARSLYQADAGGKSYCPLDNFWGMKDEFATEEVRQAVAFSMAHLTADETQQLFEKCAWFHPSATAIKNITDNIGDIVETHADTIMQAVLDVQQIPQKTDVFVVSMDGVNVLLREQGIQQGRPAQRPSLKASSSENTAYKNAMVGAIPVMHCPPEKKKGLKDCNRVILHECPRMERQPLNSSLNKKYLQPRKNFQITQRRSFCATANVRSGRMQKRLRYTMTTKN